jgi:hypothetical protein
VPEHLKFDEYETNVLQQQQHDNNDDDIPHTVVALIILYFHKTQLLDQDSPLQKNARKYDITYRTFFLERNIPELMFNNSSESSSVVMKIIKISALNIFFGSEQEEIKTFFIKILQLGR